MQPQSASPAPGPASVRSRARLADLLDRDADRLAAMVAEGMSIHAAGERLNLTRGEAASTWRRIKAGLGEQAS